MSASAYFQSLLRKCHLHETGLVVGTVLVQDSADACGRLLVLAVDPGDVGHVDDLIPVVADHHHGVVMILIEPVDDRLRNVQKDHFVAALAHQLADEPSADVPGAVNDRFHVCISLCFRLPFIVPQNRDGSKTFDGLTEMFAESFSFFHFGWKKLRAREIGRPGQRR